MKPYKKDVILMLSDLLLQQITEVLDSEGTKIKGELRSKLGIAESNLFKIKQLLENQAG